MKKVVLVLSIILTLCMLVTVFVACNKDGSSSKEEIGEIKLEAPEITISKSGVVTWRFDGAARAYSYIINGGNEIMASDEIISGDQKIELNVGDKIKFKSYACNDIVEIDGKKYRYIDSDYSEEKEYALETQQLRAAQ